MNIPNYLIKFNRNINTLIWKKHLHVSSLKYNKVRVRFAPSPTGFLHLGGLRTALYNFLYARSKEGTFILRIEDTDQTRIVDKGVENLIKDLDWAGIIADEGPHVGGNFGPYIQSERLHLYREHADKLLENGSAYKCFCTDKRINLIRKESLRTRQVPKYDNKCRHLTPETIKQNIDNELPYCIRFKLSPNAEPFEDLIYGRIHYNVGEHEGDPVIMKGDGFPTYHLANIVDDHLMEITHVLRGVEWQISTPKHILLYRASGWEPPLYGHLPLITNSDGTKLSKRQGDIRISQYRNSGIFPFALLQYITQAGGGFKTGSQFSSSIEELVENFDINLLLKSSCRLSPLKLLELNNQEIKRRLKDSKLTHELADNLKLIIETKFKSKIEHEINLNLEHIINILCWSQDRINTLADLVDDKLQFIWIFPKYLNFTSLKLDNELYEHIGYLIEIFNKIDEEKLNKEYLRDFFKNYCKENKIKFNDFMKLMRYSLSGLQDGPSVGEIIQILGKKCTLSRLSVANNYLKDNNS